MSKFKVGDRVRVLESDYDAIKVDFVTHVVEADNDEPGCMVWSQTYPEGLFFFDFEIELADALEA